MPGDFGDPYWNASCTGCTDSLANNFDPASTIDDGSCIYTVYGCTDPTACNYDALATVDDGSVLVQRQYHIQLMLVVITIHL